MTTWVVHVAGDADLNLPSDQDPSRDQAEQRAERLARRQDRLAQVSRAPADKLSNLLAPFNWTDGRPEVDGVVVAPLASLLQGLPTSDPIRLLLIGTETGDPLDTWSIAKTLDGALGRVPDLYGPSVAAQALRVDGMDEDTVSGAVEEVLAAASGDRVVVSWGSGATSLVLAALAGVLAARLRCRLALPGRDGSFYDPDPYARLNHDPLVAALLRWRYPDAILELRDGEFHEPLDAGQREVIERLAQRRAKGLRSADPGSVRSLVLDALVRPDGTAGLAVRRYVQKRYKDLVEEGEDDLLKRAEESKVYCLREQLRFLRKKIRANERPPSARWLLDNDAVDALAEIGAASHELRRPTPKQLDRVVTGFSKDEESEEFTQRTDPLDGERRKVGLPVFPVLPPRPREILVVWPVGFNDCPFGDTLLARGLGHEVLDCIGVDERARQREEPWAKLRCWLLGTTGGTLDLARTQAAALQEQGEGRYMIEATEYGVDASADVFATDPGQVVHQVSALLEAREAELTDVEAVVLGPTGLKPLVLGALVALHCWALDHGIPLYLCSLVDEGEDAAVRYHRLPALLAGDRTLARIALWAIERLEYDTAARLLRSGSRELHTHAARCEQLARAFRCDEPQCRGQWWPEPLPEDQEDRCSGLAADRVRLVQSRLRSVAGRGLAADLEDAERTRLVHLAYTALEASLARPQQGTLTEALGETRVDGPVDIGGRVGRQEALQIVKAFRRLRNNLPTTHGADGTTLRKVITRHVGKDGDHRPNRHDRQPTVDDLVDALARALHEPILNDWRQHPGDDKRLVTIDKELRAGLERFATEALPASARVPFGRRS